ncbi:MAG: hypothetical protein V1717_02330 [Candidatus Micrarchaeota archaeon]
MSLDEFAKSFGRIWTIAAYCMGFARIHLMPVKSLKAKNFKQSL